jgi:sugar lactone lactonase YvrE
MTPPWRPEQGDDAVLAEQLTESCTIHGEGPVWDEVAGVLRWVDMLAGDVITMSADGYISRLHVGSVAAALRPRAAGGLVVATERAFALLDPAGAIESVVPAFTDPGARLNDGGVDRQGRFFCGSMDFDMSKPRGVLYRFDPDQQVTNVLTGITVSNGIGWSLDGELMYYIDSVTKQIDVFDYDAATGTPSERRQHVNVEVEVEGNVPDGMALDAEGGIWVAIYGEHQVRRYDADGKLDAVIELPVDQVTACAFGGADLDKLYITTSRQDLPDDAEPAAGALFHVRPGVRGISTGTFAG